MFRSNVIALAVVAGLSFLPAARAADPVFVEATPDGGRAAIRGYDAVAYHTLGAPVLGSSAHTFTWQGAEWRFASAMNRDLFAMAPERYAPQFGGYCAFGTSRGYKVSTQPDRFAVVEGKLYLNYNAAVQQTWDQDRPGYIAKAESVWPTLAEEAYESDEAAVARVKKQKAEEAARRAASGGAGGGRGR